MPTSNEVIRWWHIIGAVALVALLDVYELTVTIPELTRLAGAPIFDMRVHGYTQTAAVRLLSALGPGGRWYYLSYHTPADTALALIECIAITLIILRATRPGARFSVWVPAPWRSTLLVAPLLMLVADLGENAAVAQMLVTGTPAPLTAATASIITQAKWVCASLSISLALVLPVTALVHGRRRLQRQHPSLN